MVILEAGAQYNNLIREIHFSPNPNLFKIQDEWPHSTQSKAFCAFTEIANSIVSYSENIMLRRCWIIEDNCYSLMKPV